MVHQESSDIPPPGAPDCGQAGSLEDRLTGVLLGIAIGDALGLPAEGLTAERIARRFGRLTRYRLLGRRGIVSDDTEQSALVAQALIRSGGRPEVCVQLFRRSLAGWFLRLPWGIGMATVRSCIRILTFRRPTGVDSGGNGAAMRAAVVGAYWSAEHRERRQLGVLLAQVTHLDPAAVQGALFSAEITAGCMRLDAHDDRFSVARDALEVVDVPALRTALERAMDLAAEVGATGEAARVLQVSGYIAHSLPFALFCWLRHGEDPRMALEEAVNAGGDTDSIGAMVGGWIGAEVGAAGLPVPWVCNLVGGPFGQGHLRSLGHAMFLSLQGGSPAVPEFSSWIALIRNLALWPVILGHGFRRLIPW